ncbi:hypothetical protein LCGC14_0944310 [marine sediment metagenome]|uniref:Uncharacterized protein n=1 Tax=marine sediment metagenome TaxID=412755 RepID=A0A0F9NNU6_9ZZZZ
MSECPPWNYCKVCIARFNKVGKIDRRVCCRKCKVVYDRIVNWIQETFH